MRATPQACAVWFVGAMGLLDDAIRDHLELRRLRGADPGDVARAEQDALGPIRRESGSEPSVHSDNQVGNFPRAAGSFFSEPAPISDAGSSVSSQGSQETVEINMEAEFERDIDAEYAMDDPYDARTTPVGHPAYTQADARWEAASGRSNEHGETAMPASDADFQLDSDSDGAQYVDDMLDETTDVPREAPEQERLWFEQHPSRDSDFNE
jgi:hypothetical protein